MATALLDAPQATGSSQLCFDWMGQGDCEAVVESAWATARRDAAPRKTDNTNRVVGRSAVSIQDGQRVGEVRIGAIMIKLLKRYGITDEEINQGLADYARKNCQSLAG